MGKKFVDRSLFVEHSLRSVREGHVLKFAHSRFVVVAQERRHRYVHLELEAEGGSRATLIGLQGASVGLRKTRESAPSHPPGSGNTESAAGVSGEAASRRNSAAEG